MPHKKPRATTTSSRTMFHIIPGHSRNIVLFYPIQKFASVLNAFLIETLEGGAIPFQGVHPGNVVGGEKEQPPLLFIVPGQLYGLVIALCPQRAAGQRWGNAAE